MEEKLIGRVTHYFTKLGVAIIELTDGELRVGQTIHVKGHTSDFTQEVDSLQIERKPVEAGKKGESVGLKTAEHAREHDQVYVVQ